jgi:hypothetical protein
VLRVDVFEEFLSHGVSSIRDAIFSDQESDESIAFIGRVFETRHSDEKPWKPPFSAAVHSFGKDIISKSITHSGEFRRNEGLSLSAKIVPTRLNRRCNF